MTQHHAAKAGAKPVAAQPRPLSKPLTRDSAPGVLVTESGKRIPELVFHPSLFLDKTTVIYGASKSGKTTQTKNIMKAVNGLCDEILIVAPTEPSNRSYEGYVDPPLVHYRLWLADPNNPKKDDGVKGSLRFLEYVWKRQEMKAAIYTRANNLKTLAKLFARIPRSARVEGARYLGLLSKKRARVIATVQDQYADNAAKRNEKRTEVNEKFKQMVILVYKKYIIPHFETIAKVDELTEDERYSLHYINFNPRLLLIFDDCAAQLKPLFSKEIFRMIFYQGRWGYMSTVLLAHDDTDVPPNLKKNAFTSIFTEPISVSSFFDRNTNKFPKSTREFVQEILPDIFQGHRKMAYIREDDKRQHFYYTDVPYQPPFLFGSDAMHELCAMVKSDGPVFDRENPFFSRFQV